MGKFIDLTGKKFGRLTVLSRCGYHVDSTSGKKRIKWLCRCDCGNEIEIMGEALKGGNQVSCGCYRNERIRETISTHGMSDTRLYNVWNSIKIRCYDENNSAYRLYGARGIKMCDEWHYDYMSFYNWAIENGYDDSLPRGAQTIDRIDVNGDYCPDNCRLANQQEQMNNVRYNRILEFNGERHTMAEWGRITGIDSRKISNRLNKLGWTVEKALTTT